MCVFCVFCAAAGARSIGSHVVDRLLADGYEVTAVDRTKGTWRADPA